MTYELLSILVAYILDLILGDPQWHWHPVRLIGRLIEALEVKLNTNKAYNKVFFGIILVITVVGTTAFCVWGILKLAKSIHQIFYFIISILSIYFALSIKALAVEVNKVRKALINKDIQEARKNLSMIVGRDTDRLSEKEIIRASVETVAEGIMDGMIAPLFYVFLGGPVLMWIYKAINTLDSMVGYRSERFIKFGKASAKLDEIMNFIPARITCFLISVSSWFYRKDGLSSLKWGLRDFFKGLEKNSQITESAMAGALGVQLGGVNYYPSITVSKPLIGDNLYSLDIKHIQESTKISYLCSILMMFAGISLMLLIQKG